MSQNTQKWTNYEMDLRGFKCPLPVLKLRKRLANTPCPFCVKILTDDPMTIIDIPAFCQEKNYICKAKGECKQKQCLYFIIENSIK